jgi:ribose-phosphate pyrophosphokinase
VSNLTNKHFKIEQFLVINMKEKATSEFDDPFEQFKYPGGELQVRLKPETIEILKTLDVYTQGVIISTNIKNSDDIMELLLLIDAVSEFVDDHQIMVFLPYLPYARADRRFMEGDCHGKDVFLSLFYGTVVSRSNLFTLDVHSESEHAEYWNVPVDGVLQDVIEQVRDKGQFVNILYPDKGAETRYSEKEYQRLVKNEDNLIYFCEKERDPITGKLLGFKVPEIDESIPTVIIDDLCDGGGTFLGIASKLKMDRNLLNLYVTHGLFSKGFEDLSKVFSKIYTTDSFLDLSTDVKIDDFEVIAYSANDIIMDYMFKNHPGVDGGLGWYQYAIPEGMTTLC